MSTTEKRPIARSMVHSICGLCGGPEGRIQVRINPRECWREDAEIPISLSGRRQHKSRVPAPFRHERLEKTECLSPLAFAVADPTYRRHPILGTRFGPEFVLLCRRGVHLNQRLFTRIRLNLAATPARGHTAGARWVVCG